MGIRSSLARGIGQATSWSLRNIAHRSASQLPGRVALAIDPHLLSSLSKKLDKGSIVVCGTNGKTTTNNIIAAAIEGSGQEVLCNRAGANMLPGVVAAMLPKKRASWAVIEADELSCPHILPELKPTYLVLLNLFRDQLDRSGEIENVQNAILKGLQGSPETCLVVCGDDPICTAIALEAQKTGTQVLYFGVDEDMHQPEDKMCEARFCQVCGARLDYEYRQYAQMGNYRCTECDFARPTLNFWAKNVQVSRRGVAFDFCDVDHKTHIQADFGGAYMVYNLMAAYCGASLAGVSQTVFQKVLQAYHPENGRLQHFIIDGRQTILNLAKNPTGFNQNISLLMEDEREKIVYLAVNDKVNDGKDISWIWDVDFERLGDAKVLKLFVDGTRAADLQVRLKYADMDAKIVDSIAQATEFMSEADKDCPFYVLTNYSALLPAKEELEQLGGIHE